MLGEKQKQSISVRQGPGGVKVEDRVAVKGGTRRVVGDESEGVEVGLEWDSARSEGGRATGKERSEVDERWRMTLPSNPTSAAPSPRALAQQRYNQALELEKQLRSLLQQKGPFDPSVRALRNRICESYEAVILEDHEFAESHEVEQAIWRLHYKCIEEFRSRIRKSTAAAAAAASAPAIPTPGSKVPLARRDTSHKILAVFKSFLAEATGFYHNLILKLRAKHGLPQDYSPFEAEPGGSGRDGPRAAELKGCDLSCHRCLIFLGDLARYKESHGDADVRSRDWSVAAGYYQQAISLWPSSGNPHNQLAVLATYVGDELLAVYRYFRSLAVESPFLTARDNLIILFEKNRNHYVQLASHEMVASAPKLDGGKLSDKVKSGRGDHILPVGDGALKLALKDHNLEGSDIGEIRKSFRIRFVRLNGILFTKTSLETFAEVYAATVRELEMLLSPDDASLEAGLGSDHRSGIGTGSSGAAGFLQLVSILIFTVHNINWGPDSHHPTYAEILQRSALFQHAFTAAFECAGRIMRRCADSKDVPKSPLLPAMLVYLEWLACRPEMAAGSDVDEKQANARAFFWRQCVALLNSCADANKMHGDVGLEGTLASLGAFGDEETAGGVALWEDYELRGFVSVVPAQITLDYSKRAPRSGLGDKEREVRVQRLLAAGKAIANALEGTGKGICYDDEIGKFVMAGELQEKKVHDADGSACLDNVLPEEIVDELEGLTVSSGSWVKDAAVNNSTMLLPKNSSVRREEEDEEVIVFKPMPKESHAFNSAPDAAWKELLAAQATSANSTVVPSYGDTRDLDMTKNVSGAMQISPLDLQRSAPVVSDMKQFAVDSSPPKSISPSLSMSQGPTSGTDNTSLPKIAGSSLPAVVSTLSGVNGSKDEDTGGVQGAYGYAPSSAADWLNHIGRPSDGFPAATLAPWSIQSSTNVFSNGSEKSPTSAGVIGQPKQAATSNSLWSTTLDSLAMSGLSNLTLGNSDYRPSSTLGGILSHSSMSLDSLIQASMKETNGASLNVFSAPLAANGMLYGGDLHSNNSRNGTGRSYGQNTTVYPLTGETGQFVGTLPDKSGFAHNKSTSLSNGASPPAPVSSSLTTKDNGVTSGRPSGMRPPPGFGPLPTKPTQANVATESQQRSSQPLKRSGGIEVEEQLQVDDYGWLDDYSQKGNIGQIGHYQGQGSSLYSSDYGIWSSGGGVNEPAPLSKVSTTYPFPGMGVSELENQTKQYSTQLLQQLLQQQQYDAQRVDYGLEQPQLQYGAQLYEYDAQQQYQIQQQLLLQQQQQQQQLQQQQQQQELWYGQYHSRDPFVS